MTETEYHPVDRPAVVAGSGVSAVCALMNGPNASLISYDYAFGEEMFVPYGAEWLETDSPIGIEAVRGSYPVDYGGLGIIDVADVIPARVVVCFEFAQSYSAYLPT